MKLASEPAGIYTCTIDTPLGIVSVCAKNGALTGLWFHGQKDAPITIDARTDNPNYPVFETLRSWLDTYFLGKAAPIDFKLEPKGTIFQKAVWNLLLKIPFG